MMKEKRTTNPIVGNKMLELAKGDNEDLDDTPAADFASDILT
jgi:hypothetical protein